MIGLRLHFQLGAAHVVPRLQQRHLVLALLNRQVGLGLLDLLVHRLHAESAPLRAPPAARESSYSTIRSFSLASAPTGARSVTCTVPFRLGASQGQRRAPRATHRAKGADHHVAALHLGGGNRVLPFRQLTCSRR